MYQPPGTFCVAVEAVIVLDGKLLVTQRSPQREHAPGEWEFLSGRMNQGESFEDAVRREVREEVGLEVEVGRPINTFHFYRGPDKVEHLGVSFLCTYISGDVVLDTTEQIAYKWATVEEAEKLIKDKGILGTVAKAKPFFV